MTFSPLSNATELHAFGVLVDLNNTTARNVEPVTDTDRILDVMSCEPANWSFVDTARA